MLAYSTTIFTAYFCLYWSICLVGGLTVNDIPTWYAGDNVQFFFLEAPMPYNAPPGIYESKSYIQKKMVIATTLILILDLCKYHIVFQTPHPHLSSDTDPNRCWPDIQ